MEYIPAGMSDAAMPEAVTLDVGEDGGFTMDFS